jgi:hypothetical protein
MSDITQGNAICPESTIESANRRNFIKKAAVVAAAAGIGSTALARNFVPDSSGSSDTHLNGCCSSAYGYGVEGTASGNYGYGVEGTASGTYGVGVKGTATGPCGAAVFGMYSPTVACRPVCVISGSAVAGCGPFTGVVGSSSPIYICSKLVGGCFPGVEGISRTGPGVSGFSSSGVGVEASVGEPSGTPIVAKGYTSQTACLQRWQIGCDTPLSVMNNKGWLGIGTCVAANAICVKASSGSNAINAEYFGSAGSGIFASGPIGVAGRSCTTGGVGVHARAGTGSATPLVAEGQPGQSANLQEWQIFGTPCPTTLSVVNGCGWLGVGTSTPKTTLQVNGSIGTKVVSPTTTTYCLGTSCFAVLTNSATTVNLPKASATPAGMIVLIKRTGASKVTVKPHSGDKIESKTSISLSKQYDSLLLMSNGSNEWFLVGNSVGDKFVS